MQTLIAFQNPHYVMMAERILKREGIRVFVLPLPAQISAGCGLCLAVEPEDMEKSVQALLKNNIEAFEVYTKTMKDGKIVNITTKPGQ